MDSAPPIEKDIAETASDKSTEDIMSSQQQDKNEDCAPLDAGGVARTEERLMITHIDNFNFKSYAGKQTLGPFHKV